jgi:hypothetical protein
MSDTDKPDPERDARQLRFLRSIFLDEVETPEAFAAELARIEKLSDEELRRELDAEGFDSANEWSVEELLARVERKAQELALAKEPSGSVEKK